MSIKINLGFIMQSDSLYIRQDTTCAGSIHAKSAVYAMNTVFIGIGYDNYVREGGRRRVVLRRGGEGDTSTETWCQDIYDS